MRRAARAPPRQKQGCGQDSHGGRARGLEDPPAGLEALQAPEAPFQRALGGRRAAGNGASGGARQVSGG